MYEILISKFTFFYRKNMHARLISSSNFHMLVKKLKKETKKIKQHYFQLQFKNGFFKRTIEAALYSYKRPNFKPETRTGRDRLYRIS